MTTIERVECLHLRFTMPPERTFSTPGGPATGRLTTLVRLTTDDGLVGIGSAYAHPALVQATVDHLTPFVLGYDPRQTERHWNRLHGISRWYGRKGAAVSAIGGIDQAMWDLAARWRANRCGACSVARPAGCRPTPAGCSTARPTPSRPGASGPSPEGSHG